MKFLNKLIPFFLTVFSLNSFCLEEFSLSSLGTLGLATVKNKLKKAANLALNYAIFNKSISFKDIDDFTADDTNFLTYTLAPGSALKISCGTKESFESGLISLYPRDLQTNSLGPMSKSGINESINRVIKNFDLFRSDSTLIYKTDSSGNSYMIQHPYSSVIVSKDLNFTLNFACVYNTNLNSDDTTTTGDSNNTEITGNGLNSNTNNKNSLLYKWIEVKFTDVFPMSYGCGSGNHLLFNNLNPTNVVKNSSLSKLRNLLSSGRTENIENSSFCEIEAKPGMIIGVYCKEGDKFNDELCFQDRSFTTFYDQTFKFTNASKNLHLYKVPENGYNKDLTFMCSCMNSNNEIVSEVKVVNKIEFVCDLSKLFNRLSVEDRANRNRKTLMKLCKNDLHPGQTLKLIVPINNTVYHYLGGRYKVILEPNDIRINTYNQLMNYTDINLNKVDNVMVQNNFIISKRMDNINNTMEYTFEYKKDAILILKTENVSLNYYLTLINADVNYAADIRSRNNNNSLPNSIIDRSIIEFSTLNRKVAGVININLVPTDPYLAGCGIRNEFFKSSDMDYKNRDLHLLSMNENKIKFEKSYLGNSCKLDIRKGPVGFYCPKPFKLIPNGCFNKVLIRSSFDSINKNGNNSDSSSNQSQYLDANEIIVDLNKMGKGYRSHKSTHLVILELLNTIKIGDYYNMSNDDDNNDINLDEINEFYCKCMDNNDKVISSIHIINPYKRTPTDTNVPEEEEPAADPNDVDPNEHPSTEDDFLGDIDTRIN